jgi:hypothetical protein
MYWNRYRLHKCSTGGLCGFTEVLEARCLLSFEKLAVIFLRIYSILHLPMETRTQRQTRKLISSANPAAKTRHFSFSRAQSRVVIGHLTGHKPLRRRLHLIGLTNNPLCMRCGADYETSAHMVCECKGSASPTDMYIWAPFFFRPEYIKRLRLGSIWNFIEKQGFPKLVSDCGAQRTRF